eukprot:m.242216 g.242216  ORF g.242216 m.242216 type:complete len:307 (+) comp16090_c0_seq15:119-1039(+)
MAAENSANEYFVIRGIPKQLRTADLRHFFSDALEAAIFQTFHFKHRPEIDAYKGPDIRVEGNERQNLNGPGCCCVVAVLSASGQDFLEEYQGVQWFDRGGNVLEASIWIEPVFSDPLNAYSEAVRKILVKGDSGVPAALSTNTPSCISALRTLSELRPPSGLPQGNVGTPQKTIMKMIQECRIPPSVVKKLNLKFTGVRKPQYGNVPMDYGTVVIPGVKRNWYRRQPRIPLIHPKDTRIAINSQEHDEEGDDLDEDESREDHDAEEWERHEALHAHEDIDGQERAKDRLFEQVTIWLVVKHNHSRF